MRVRAIRTCLVAALVALAPSGAGAVRLIGTSFIDGLVYAVDATTGAATNPRSATVIYACESGLCAAILNSYSGIEIEPDGSLLLAPVEVATNFGSQLVCAHDGAALTVASSAPLGRQIGEGDLALDPVSGDLYAFALTNLSIPFLLLRIEPGANGWADPTTSVVGPIGSSDVSALAFDAAGTLYAIDTGADTLRVLDLGDAHTVSSVALSEPLGALAGMDFDPASGTLYVADGGVGGQNALFTLDPTTGVLDEIGPLGLAEGLSGLAVPEPDAMALGATALVALARCARRKGAA